jgi:hypothetical protein
MDIDLNLEKCDNGEVVIHLKDGGVIKLGAPCPPLPAEIVFKIDDIDNLLEKEKNGNPS